MQTTVGIYTVILEMNQIVIRKNGETIRAIEVEAGDDFAIFDAMVTKLKALK
jgi:hypothetical protein